MKLKSIISIGLFSAATLLTSCLKNKNDIGLISDKGSILVEIPEATYNAQAGTDQIVSFLTTPAQEAVKFFTLRASYPRDNKPGSDIRVKLTTAPVAGYDVVPANALSIPSEIVIPKETGVADVKITVNKAPLDPAADYAITFKIAQVSEGIISDFAKEITVYLVVKNQYDGKFTMTGTLNDVGVAGISAKSPANVELVSTGANSVYLHNSGAASASFLDLFPIISAGAESAYGSFTPEFIFDATGKVTSVVNVYGQPAANTRSAQIDPSGVNQWDAATKTLRVKWFMFQPSVVPSGPRTSFNFTFTYTGPR